ncbi:uncharacterized protein B0H18DRAFT_971585 [Fomitopsis serialis]|uniref:uncharacterized protein n=1 Tax=Fomitopsis serialis TaxID=139415 RepID=UPI002007369C|nr:uncharacterized protein B0H18DRAFT_971585 [Neoantrodia serialis]KAH9937645.1 hypothetical protein B0H18DRAFT_971585 [Neoantrodia serialis]
MVTPVARIRAFQPSDDKDVRFIVGKAAMEPLAVANMKVYMHPVTLAIWGGLSCIFIQYMQWWPHPDYGILGYLLPLPGFASMAVPLMFLCDWFNRHPIEEQMQQVLHRPDLVNIAAWYARSPSSGVWILEFGDKFSLAKRGKKAEFPKGTSYTAVVRHFYVDEAYRPAGAQHDLLLDPTVQEVKCDDSPLRKYAGDALRKAGFELEWKTDKIGMLGWQNSLRTLNRSKWTPVA